MAYIRKRRKKWQVVIRRKGHPHIAKSFTSYSLATSWAQEFEANIEKGLFADLSEANQTLLRDALQRYKDEVTAKKKGAKQESYKIDKLMRHRISNYSLARLVVKLPELAFTSMVNWVLLGRLACKSYVLLRRIS